MIAPLDVAREEAEKENREFDTKKQIEKIREMEKRKFEILYMKDRTEALFLEIKELVMPKLSSEDSEKIYLETTSRLLRIQKIDNVIYIMGHDNSEHLLNLANGAITKLKAEFPDEKFVLDA